MPRDEEVVSAASTAAGDLIFSRFDRTEVRDLDVTVSFADGELTVDVYLNTGAETSDERAYEQQVADDAALAAQRAVDRLFAEEA